MILREGGIVIKKKIARDVCGRENSILTAPGLFVPGDVLKLLVADWGKQGTA